MANLCLPNDRKGRLTFILALSAFLISMTLAMPTFLESLGIVTSNFHTNEWLMFAQTMVFVASAWIAYTTINSSQATARERATLDIILNDNQDSHLYQSKMNIFAFSENPEEFLRRKSKRLLTDDALKKMCTSLTQLFEHDPKTSWSQVEENLRGDLMRVLSRHEFYAVGINSGLLDETLFKRMHCSNIIKLWETVSSAVNHLRTKSNKDTLFKDLEILANRWKTDPLTLQHLAPKKS